MGNALTIEKKKTIENALTFLYGKYVDTPTTEASGSGGAPYTTTVSGVTVLAHDLFNFQNTLQVPEGLSQRVVSSRKDQAEWYVKLHQAWREAKRPPRTLEEVARLVVQTLIGHQQADVEGLLEFYGLPRPSSSTLVEISAGVSTRLPEGVVFEMHTLPVTRDSVPDGDGINVYVDTADPWESSSVPIEVSMAAVEMLNARAHQKDAEAHELGQKIIESGYQVLNLQNEEILARKYRIRLRGIDAPENAMPYGKEAKEELVKLVEGKCLRVLVYDEDRYGRYVADVYCNDILLQEKMLKKGLAWHYVVYDQRNEFATWENEAKAKRIGLWASPNPEEPWKWRKVRKDRGEGGSHRPHSTQTSGEV